MWPRGHLSLMTPASDASREELDVGCCLAAKVGMQFQSILVPPPWGKGTTENAGMRRSGDMDMLEKASEDWECIRPARKEKGSKVDPVLELAFRVATIEGGIFCARETQKPDD